MTLEFEKIFPLRPQLPLPNGVAEKELFDWLKNVCVEGAPKKEMEQYCTSDFRRFIYTFGLVNESISLQGGGRCLELGSNPYFTTMLLKNFTSIDLTLANYFEERHPNGVFSQKVNCLEFYPQKQEDAKKHKINFHYHHFNIEEDDFPFEDGSFHIVLFCEIIEHLLMNPVKVLLEIRRILKPGGQLILTTPNVSRLENVARMLSGTNIYDPYSGYGPYGRHNREYNKHELHLLLNYLGFTIRTMFTADVHENNTSGFFDLSGIINTLKFREADLGQYIFLRAARENTGKTKKPAWLYRSYPQDELDG